MRRLAFRREPQALVDAKPMLLVHHHKGKVFESDSLLKNRVRADQNINIACLQPGEYVLPHAPLFIAGEDGGAHACLFRQRRDSAEVLAGENFRRRHQNRLPASLRRLRHGDQRDNRFP